MYIKNDKERLESLLVEGFKSGHAKPLDLNVLRENAQNILKTQLADQRPQNA